MAEEEKVVANEQQENAPEAKVDAPRGDRPNKGPRPEGRGHRPNKDGKGPRRPREEEKEFEIVRVNAHTWRITGEKITKFYKMTNISTDEGMMILLTKLRKLRVDDVLEEMGAVDGDTVILDDFAFDFVR